MRRFILTTSLLLVAGAYQAQTQPTNLEGFQQLAQRCLRGELPDSLHAFRLNASTEKMPYLRSALVERWRHAQRRVFVTDSTAHLDVPLFAYIVDEASVRYERAPRNHLQRAQQLTLRYTLTGPDGELLLDRRCRKSRSDTVARDHLAALEDEAFPETQAPPPPPGVWRRYLKPALLVAATAVGVFLFFSIRSSDRSDSP